MPLSSGLRRRDDLAFLGFSLAVSGMTIRPVWIRLRGVRRGSCRRWVLTFMTRAPLCGSEVGTWGNSRVCPTDGRCNTLMHQELRDPPAGNSGHFWQIDCQVDRHKQPHDGCRSVARPFEREPQAGTRSALGRACHGAAGTRGKALELLHAGEPCRARPAREDQRAARARSGRRTSAPGRGRPGFTTVSDCPACYHEFLP